MTRHAIELRWVGGAHPFLLPLGALRALQEACNAGPMQILNGLRDGNWRVDWPLATIREGLIGGGMDAGAAKALVSQTAATHPLADLLVPAIYTLSHALVGVPDDPVGDADPGEGTGELSPPENGSSAGTTPTAQRVASAPAT